MKKILLLLYCVLFCAATERLVAQQNVGIGIPNPDPSAVLHLDATNKGLLVPRLTATQRTAIAAPANGLLVYDTDSSCFFYFSASAVAWQSLCQVGGAGKANAIIDLSFNPLTDSLSVTDSIGTHSTYIPPPGRWSSKGSTDINTSTSAFTTMAGTSLTFTPSKSVVYIMASAAGDADLAHQSECIVEARIRNTGTNTTIAGSQTVANATYLNTVALTLAIGIAWNISMVTPYNVIPGVPVTIELQWAVQWADHVNGPAYCNPATQPDAANRSIVVFE